VGHIRETARQLEFPLLAWLLDLRGAHDHALALDDPPAAEPPPERRQEQRERHARQRLQPDLALELKTSRGKIDALGGEHRGVLAPFPFAPDPRGRRPHPRDLPTRTDAACVSSGTRIRAPRV